MYWANTKLEESVWRRQGKIVNILLRFESARNEILLSFDYEDRQKKNNFMNKKQMSTN